MLLHHKYFINHKTTDVAQRKFTQKHHKTCLNKTESIHHNQKPIIVDCKQIKVMQTKALIPSVKDQSILIRKLKYTEDKSMLRGNSHLTATMNCSPANHLCKAHHKTKKQERGENILTYNNSVISVTE